MVFLEKTKLRRERDVSNWLIFAVYELDNYFTIFAKQMC